jgi:hypothetical protein
MSGIFGALGLNDTDRVFQATVGQAVIYQQAADWVAQQNAALNAALSVFVDETTSDYKRRYKLPGGGRLQRIGPNAQPGATKAYGAWDVAFPLEDFGAQVAGDRVTMAYMTVAELDRHMQTVVAQNVATVRYEALKALFNSTSATFVDPLWGSLTVKRLANGDADTYPPVLGSETEATDTHYLESGYAASAISDTNDPIVTMVDELEEHFGAQTGGSEIVIFCNNAQRAKLQDLTDFDPVIDRYIQPGAQTDVPTLPGGTLPGRTLGRHNAGAWVQEWRWIPANYLLAVHMGAPRPLVKRRDPEDTGLPPDLAMVAEDAEYPFQASFWSHRFGFGVGNRLNGVAMELGTGGTYTVPTAYQ